MKTDLIDNPLTTNYIETLQRIESDPESFTTGRRNNDLVNWFLIKRIIDIVGGEDPMRSLGNKIDSYTADFTDLTAGLTAGQQYDLSHWHQHSSWISTQPAWKIQVLCEHYSSWLDIRSLAHLWLPMDYVVLGQPENQLTLLAEEG